MPALPKYGRDACITFSTEPGTADLVLGEFTAAPSPCFLKHSSTDATTSFMSRRARTSLSERTRVKKRLRLFLLLFCLRLPPPADLRGVLGPEERHSLLVPLKLYFDEPDI